MMMHPMRIQKKIQPRFFEDVLYHNKRFEIRKDEDGIVPYDTLILAEWDSETEEYTGRSLLCDVLYVFRADNYEHDFGLKPGYCVIGFMVVG